MQPKSEMACLVLRVLSFTSKGYYEIIKEIKEKS